MKQQFYQECFRVLSFLKLYDVIQVLFICLKFKTFASGQKAKFENCSISLPRSNGSLERVQNSIRNLFYTLFMEFFNRYDPSKSLLHSRKSFTWRAQKKLSNEFLSICPCLLSSTHSCPTIKLQHSTALHLPWTSSFWQRISWTMSLLVATCCCYCCCCFCWFEFKLRGSLSCICLENRPLIPAVLTVAPWWKSSSVRKRENLEFFWPQKSSNGEEYV